VGKSELTVKVFGRTCHLVVEDRDGQGAEWLALGEKELTRLEDKFSSYVPGSVPSQMNQSAGTGKFTPLDAEAHSLFQYVDALWSESKHQFDPTTRVLQSCYDENGSLLGSPVQLRGNLELVGWRKVEVTEEGAYMPFPGMLVDLNTCIRPYAMDSVRKILIRHGVESACIELGSEAATIGRQPDGANWLVGARAPRGPRGAIFRLKLNNKGFAVRGDFERTTVISGEHFGRAVSPVDGLPIPGLLSVCVIAENCLTACSAASIARTKTEAAGLKWLEALGVPWMAVDRRFKCHGPLAQP